MPLAKSFHSGIQYQKFKQFTVKRRASQAATESGEAEKTKLLVAKVILMTWKPGDNTTAKGYYVDVFVPKDASESYKTAALQFAKQKLIHDCDLKLISKVHFAFRSSLLETFDAE